MKNPVIIIGAGLSDLRALLYPKIVFHFKIFRITEPIPASGEWKNKLPLLEQKQVQNLVTS